MWNFLKKKKVQAMRTNWPRGSVQTTSDPLPPMVTFHSEQKIWTSWNKGLRWWEAPMKHWTQSSAKCGCLTTVQTDMLFHSMPIPEKINLYFVQNTQLSQLFKRMKIIQRLCLMKRQIAFQDDHMKWILTVISWKLMFQLDFCFICLFNKKDADLQCPICKGSVLY